VGSKGWANAHPCGAASVGLAGDGVAHATARLISTYVVREVIVERPQRVCAIITHPRASGAAGHSELDAVIHGRNADMRIVLVRRRRPRKDCRKRDEKRLEHCYNLLNRSCFKTLDIMKCLRNQ